MEISIRISQEDFRKLDMGKAMDGEKVRLDADVLMMSMYVKDGAIEECEAKAELWDNLPKEIQEKYKEPHYD